MEGGRGQSTIAPCSLGRLVDVLDSYSCREHSYVCVCVCVCILLPNADIGGLCTEVYLLSHEHNEFSLFSVAFHQASHTRWSDQGQSLQVSS